MAKMSKQFDRAMVEAEEDALIDCQFLLQELMVTKNINRSALAELVGISKARLSQILSADANPTLKTIVGLVHAMGEKLLVASTPLAAAHEIAIFESATETDWKFSKPAKLAERAEDADLVAIVKGGAASNDNYSYRREGLDPELFVMEPEDEAA
jgi:DNA-binding phage protein